MGKQGSQCPGISFVPAFCPSPAPPPTSTAPGLVRKTPSSPRRLVVIIGPDAAAPHVQRLGPQIHKLPQASGPHHGVAKPPGTVCPVQSLLQIRQKNELDRRKPKPPLIQAGVGQTPGPGFRLVSRRNFPVNPEKSQVKSGGCFFHGRAPPPRPTRGRGNKKACSRSGHGPLPTRVTRCLKQVQGHGLVHEIAPGTPGHGGFFEKASIRVRLDLETVGIFVKMFQRHGAGKAGRGVLPPLKPGLMDGMDGGNIVFPRGSPAGLRQFGVRARIKARALQQICFAGTHPRQAGLPLRVDSQEPGRPVIVEIQTDKMFDPAGR